MNEERMKVLEMVADGTISADDAAKLLDALNDGGSRQRIRPPHPPRHPRHGGPFQGVFHSVGGMMGELMKEMRVGFAGEEVPADAVEVDRLDEELPPEVSVHLRSVGHRLCAKAGDVRVTRSETGRLVANPIGDHRLRVLRGENELRIYIGDGGLELQVPDSAHSLQMALKAGSVSVQGLSCQFKARTMGGGVRVVRPGACFSVKTMGGGLDVILGPEWSGGSKAKTMGGGVSVELLEGFSGQVDASTMGGSVDVSGVRLIEDKSTPGASRKLVAAGDQRNASLLVVKTMGGGVTIKGGEDV